MGRKAQILILILIIGFVMAEEKKRLGPYFHYHTSYSPRGYLGPLVWNRAPKIAFPFKAKVQLPKPQDLQLSLFEALKRRRSRRWFSRASLSLQELSNLLWAAGGATKIEDGVVFRTHPSGGALYPIYLYIIVERVDGLEKGIYVYLPAEHQLGFLRKGDFTDRVLHFSPQGDRMARAAINILLVSFFDKITWKYLDRGYRYAYIEAGNISQNIYLACEAMNLSTVAIGAFYDTIINDLLGLNGTTEGVILIHPVGRR